MMPFDKERLQKRHHKMLQQEKNSWKKRQAASTDESKQARGRDTNVVQEGLIEEIVS